MKWRKVINKPIAHEEDGVKVAGGVNAVIEANVGESGDSAVSSKQSLRIVQKDGRTEVTEPRARDTRSDS